VHVTPVSLTHANLGLDLQQVSKPMVRCMVTDSHKVSLPLTVSATAKRGNFHMFPTLSLLRLSPCVECTAPRGENIKERSKLTKCPPFCIPEREKRLGVHAMLSEKPFDLL
jgi:hypothetical protein